ncbi:MAG: nickel transporter [Planctomycetota bacterium]
MRDSTLGVFLACVLAACAASGGRSERRAGHALDGLDRNEIEAAGEALRSAGDLREGVELVSLTLAEPAKDAGERQRRALAVLYDRKNDRTREALVDLAAPAIVSRAEVPGAQPMLRGPDYRLAGELLDADPRWRAALARRNLDPKHVETDSWSAGVVSGLPPGRYVRVIHFLRGEQKNGYGPPIEGLEALIDLARGLVVDVIDEPGPRPGSESTDFHDPAVRGEPRPGLKPLRTVQPEGPSFSWHGNELRWQGWRMRWSFDDREGLVLRGIGIEDGGRVRSVLRRASISEMWVPYGDPATRWAWRNAFDAGEYGLGQLANGLVPGLDVPEHAELLDASVSDSRGRARTREAVVAVFERDGGILWSHGGDPTVGTRSRELVWRFVVTAGNYDYGFEWAFRQDGSIGFRTDLTGIVLAKGVAAERCGACSEASGADGTLVPSGEERFGTLIAPRVLGVNHQHLVSVRLDFDVDGPRNALRELDFESDASAANAFVVRRRELPVECGRDADASRQRSWEVYAPGSIAAFGHQAGWRIAIPGAVPVFAAPDSSERRLAAFVDHALWATRWKPRELFAAGDYPSQGRGDGGVERYAADGEALAGEDLVVWATIGVAHAPRPEDWPIMPAAHAGLELTPHGFFARNPALDLGR